MSEQMTALTQAVVAQLNLMEDDDGDDGSFDVSTMQDIVNNGAAGGFNGFIYHSETIAFYDANEDAIWDALYDDAAQSFGSTPMQIIAGLEYADQIADTTTFKNALAWYALEHAANEILNA